MVTTLLINCPVADSAQVIPVTKLEPPIFSLTPEMMIIIFSRNIMTIM